MIDRTALAQMKSSAILINTARGGLIDEAAVAEALHTGRSQPWRQMSFQKNRSQLTIPYYRRQIAI